MSCIAIRKRAQIYFVYWVCATLRHAKAGLAAIVNLDLGLHIQYCKVALLDLEGNDGVNMGILIGSAMAAGHYFLKDHQRLPTAAEKRWLVFMSFLASVLVSLVFVLAIAAMQPESVAVMWMMLQEHAVIFLIVMLVVSLVYLLVLWLGYGFMLDRQFKAMQKKAASDRSS